MPRHHAPAADAFARWPAHRPLAVIWEGGEAKGRRTMLAEPSMAVVLTADDKSARADELHAANGDPLGTSPRRGDPLALLAEYLDAPATDAGSAGWIACISYDLAPWIEPSVISGPLARPRAETDRPWPLAVLLRCERGLVVEDEMLRPFGGFGLAPGPTDSAPFTLSEFTRGTPQADFERSVARAVEYVRAGDVFQVNLAHRLSAAFSGSARSAFLALARRAGPWHGAYLELPPIAGERAAVLSASPELFLDLDFSAGTVTTRPMKGTRPGSADPRELRESAKDRAELNMITDLMRNDLGRIAQLRSVRVADERTIERHAATDARQGGILQATARITAQLRPDLSWRQILTATFPPGSVTGAPKVRAMQIIDELEPVRRGPYCGSIGWIGDDQRARLNVAIRTALVRGRGPAPGAFADATLDYSVGAGIVADSTPRAEWEETLQKAAILDSLIASGPAPPFTSSPGTQPAGARAP